MAKVQCLRGVNDTEKEMNKHGVAHIAGSCFPYIGIGKGMSIEELCNILQRVMRHQDQEMRNLTDNLLSIKTQEISRLEETKREQTAKINRLNDELKESRQKCLHLAEAGPATEDVRDEVKQENMHLKLQLQSAKDELKESRQKCLHLAEQVQQLKMYEVKYSEASQQLDNLNNTVVPKKESAIDQLQEKLTHLTKEIERLKGQLGDELPTLTERSIHLQDKVDTLTEQNQQYQENIKILEVSLTSLREGSLKAMEQGKHMEYIKEQLKAKTEEMVTVKAQIDQCERETRVLCDKLLTLTERSTDLQNKVETLTKKNRQYQGNIKTLEARLAMEQSKHIKHTEVQLRVKTKEMVSLQTKFDNLKTQKEQLERSESTTTHLQEHVDQMCQQNQLLDAELGTSQRECLHLAEQIQQLKMYEEKYSEASQQLDYLNNTVVPKKESAIDQLQKELTDLNFELGTSQRECLQRVVQIQQLKMYEKKYSEASEQLEYLNNTVVPEKDSAIDQLQQKITDLNGR
ncbi:interaptin-like [Ruditapes philippinarum]|uniref:interaptin-like n=1 Tax=Ruditapes philippinarum TaxID=129788 RepID=UPI00295AF161|nr:interaptin-like [Ruditapes philippinarum]